jgi:hypothetical protein
MFPAILKRIAVSISAAGILFQCTPALHAADRGPSTPEERQQAVDYTKDFLANPVGPKGVHEREWVLEWAIAVPDVHVTVCLLLEKQPKGNKQDANTIFAATVLAQTAFAIQHPDAQRDSHEAFLAGIQGALQVYEELLAARPKDRQPYLDDLLQRRAAGTLPQWVADRAGKACSK